LHLVSLPKESLEQDTFSLLKLFFYPREKPEQFISFTETPTELSFLVDDISFSLLQKVISKSHSNWRALQLCDTMEGPNGN
jgi:hypothetical protein